jgi:hypothetical protein
MDPAGQYAYFMTTFGASLGRVVRIELDGFTRVGHLDLEQGWVDAAVVDPDGRFAYLGRRTPGADRIDKVDLDTFTLVDTIELSEAMMSAAAVDPDGRYAVFAQEGFPSYLHRVDLDGFTVDATLTYDSGDLGRLPASERV